MRLPSCGGLHSRRPLGRAAATGRIAPDLFVARERIVCGSWKSNGARVSFSQTCFCVYGDGERGGPGGPHSFSHAFAPFTDPDRGMRAAPRDCRFADRFERHRLVEKCQQGSPLGLRHTSMAVLRFEAYTNEYRHLCSHGFLDGEPSQKGCGRPATELDHCPKEH